MAGLLVAIEGLDGSGKSTLAGGLRDRLEELGHPTVLTREPTSLVTGKVLRERLMGERIGGMVDAAIDAEYFVADRILHNDRIIGPALKSGKHVVSDRYDLGTLAYQSTQGLPLRYLIEKRQALLDLGLIAKPDMQLLVDVAPETAMKRLAATGKRLEKFEALNFLSALRKTYLDLPSHVDDQITILHGDAPPAELLAAAMKAITPLLSHQPPLP